MFNLTIFSYFLYVSQVSSGGSNEVTPNFSTQNDPFTPKASLLRYWNKHVSNNLSKPQFLLSKASPLSAIDAARLTKFATQNQLSSHFDSFCSLANLFCFFDSVKIGSHSRPRDANFAVYSGKSFTNYGSSQIGRVDSFKNYSDGLNTPNDSFKKYSRDSGGRREEFTSYATDANVATNNFTSYGAGATGGSGEFKNYQGRVNVPNLRFNSYDSDSNNHKLSFSVYTDETNSGSESFIMYGKEGNAIPNEFTSYSDNANAIDSSFAGYSDSGNAAYDSFKAYGRAANNPHNDFKSYGVHGNAGIDTFTNYRDGANVGEDSFQSYAIGSNAGKVSFSNYGNTFNPSNSTFKDYGRGSKGQTAIGFKSYSMNRSFKYYINKGVNFAGYVNVSSSGNNNGLSVNKWVEEGKFFRESMLKQGNVMVMPDIKDKMPKRSFLPRTISSKLPFSTSRLAELREIFHAPENSTMESVIVNALTECEREASRGETKRCVGSIEDMIEFATSVLGPNVAVRSTENVNGSKGQVMIGSVKGINGGKVTESVSCHQSLYPYLLYYCHSVPKVRVYEAEILEVESRTVMNRGVAICHVDTSAWGGGHGAFVALGFGPGQIEVCHWIFENDMTWTIGDN